MDRVTIGMWQIICGAICWGCLGILGAGLNHIGFTGFEVASLRIVIAAILLAALPYFRRQLAFLSWKQLPTLCIQSLTSILGSSLFFFAAVAQIGTSLAVALLYTSPIWSLILARMILGESISKQSAMLTVVAAAGVALIMSGGAQINIGGILIGLCSGICYALYGVLGKRAMENNPPMLVFVSSICISAIAMLFMPNTLTAFTKLINSPFYAWLSAIGIAAVGTVAAFCLYVKGLEKMPAARAAVFTVIEPLTAVLLAAVILSERLSIYQYLGIVFIVGTAILNAYTHKPKTPSNTFTQHKKTA